MSSNNNNELSKKKGLGKILTRAQTELRTSYPVPSELADAMQDSSQLTTSTAHCRGRGGGAYVSISPSYSRVSDKLRRLSAGSFQCSVFCGGVRCKYERAERWRDEDKALKGLFSHWVTGEILAMARPSTQLFRTQGLIEQFKR